MKHASLVPRPNFSRAPCGQGRRARAKNLVSGDVPDVDETILETRNHACKTDSSNISFHVRSNRERRRLVARFFVEGLGAMSLQKRVRLSSEWRSILRGRGKERLSKEVCVFVNVLSLHVIYCTKTYGL